MYRAFLTFVYLIGISAAGYLAVRFYGYYSLPMIERPHSILHRLAKPGGDVGHGLGILGSTMVLLLLLYTLRKRGTIRWGSLSNWLDTHIMLGILGPLFLTLHTSFKFNGIVSVSYFSMLAVMTSGFFGRYLYLQIPRAFTGAELDAREIRSRREELRGNLKEAFGLEDGSITELLGTLGLREHEDHAPSSAILMLGRMVVFDLWRPVRNILLRREIRKKHPELSPVLQEKLAIGIRELGLLIRKILYLDTVNRIFYYWHVIHRPFALVMILIMFVHVGVGVYYGYRWIF